MTDDVTAYVKAYGKFSELKVDDLLNIEGIIVNSLCFPLRVPKWQMEGFLNLNPNIVNLGKATNDSYLW